MSVEGAKAAPLDLFIAPLATRCGTRL